MESRGRRASPYPQPPSSPEATSGALRVWGVVGVGGCRWFGVLESCMVVRGVAWSYPGACGRTWRRAVVPWRGSKVRPRGAAYDRARGGTTARVGVRPHGAGGPTMTKQCALPGTPGSTGQRCAAVSAHGTGLHNSGLQRHRPAQDRIGGSFNARLHRPTARAGGAGLRGLQDASRTHVGAGTCTRSSTRRAPKTSGAQCAGGGMSEPVAKEPPTGISREKPGIPTIRFARSSRIQALQQTWTPERRDEPHRRMMRREPTSPTSTTTDSPSGRTTHPRHGPRRAHAPGPSTSTPTAPTRKSPEQPHPHPPHSRTRGTSKRPPLPIEPCSLETRTAKFW